MIVAGGIILLFWGVGNREKKCRRIAVLVLLLVLIFFLIGLGIKNGLLDRLYPVSYTHLDVYKRQKRSPVPVLWCGRWISSFPIPVRCHG